MTAREIFDETEIFTEALGASVAQGNLTVAQLKRQLEDGLAYVEAKGTDNVAEELLVALAALDEVIQRVTTQDRAVMRIRITAPSMITSLRAQVYLNAALTLLIRILPS